MPFVKEGNESNPNVSSLYKEIDDEFKIGKIPQGLIEKYLRAGKIKINKRKIRSSTKVRTDDVINFFNIDFKEVIIQKKIKFIKLKI